MVLQFLNESIPQKYLTKGQVLAKWQERQRDWEKIQSDISNRIGASKKHTLMMAKTENYRARAEQYDLLIASVPFDERHSANAYFEWGLRGGGPRTVSVGHIFSGLYSTVEDDVRPPTIVRKPRKLPGMRTGTIMGGSGRPGTGLDAGSLDSLSSTMTNTKFMDETEAFVQRKKHLSKTMTQFRPHDITFDDAAALVVQSQDLFDWAIQSSSAYFEEEAEKKREKEQREAEARNKTIQQLSEMANARRASLNSRPSSIGGSMSSPNARRSSYGNLTNALNPGSQSARMIFMTEQEIIFSGRQGETVFQTVTFINTGTTVLEYSWKPEYLVSGLPYLSPRGQSDVLKMLHSKDKNSLTRAHHLKEQRDSFFCVKRTGRILPGETIHTLFSFCSKGFSGSVTESWILETTPRAYVYLKATPVSLLTHTPQRRQSISQMSLMQRRQSFSTAQKPPDSVYTSMSPIKVNMNGHAIDIDESTSKRDAVTGLIDRLTVQSLLADEVARCLSRVRDPVRPAHITERKRKLFEAINASLLKAVGGVMGCTAPLYVTPPRLLEFEELCQKAMAFSHEVTRNLYQLRCEQIGHFGSYFDPAAESQESKDPFSLSAMLADILSSTEAKRLAECKTFLFPEKNIVSSRYRTDSQTDTVAVRLVLCDMVGHQ
jgi:hypothetical protein